MRGHESKESDTAGIYQNEQNLFILAGPPPPIPLRGIKCQKFGFLDIFSETGH